MSSPDDSQHNISPAKNNDFYWNLEIYVEANHPELLTGLDRWLELGLISHPQVKQICRHHLSCTLPQVNLATATPKIAPIADTISEPELAIAKLQPNLIQRFWQGFLDELSIRWLLFLGIFLVIVSSGVLAASQWNNFPVFGQYLILLVYTLAFWSVGFWSSKQENLQLTAKSLSAIALLLMPINCWAISHFGLGNNILEWVTLIVSLAILSTLVYWQLTFKYQYKKILVAFFLLFSYVHLGWQIIPLLVIIYGGIAVTCLIHYYLLLPQAKYPVFNLLFLLFAWSLLLIRALLSNDSILDYQLAIATFGWILATIYIFKEKDRQLTTAFASKVLQTLGIILFIVTWLISILGGIFYSPLFFWQTVGISALAICLFSQRLTLYWRKRDLTAIFFIGLQTLYISKELIPQNLRSDALDLAVNISKTEYLPESVFGVTLFPYIILFVIIASWLYRRQKSGLAIYAEGLTLLLGTVLTSVSLSNPTWRSLNLLFSTLTLCHVARQPTRMTLVYLTHCLGLVTVVNSVAVIFPNLSQSIWGSLLVLLMAGEWAIYIHHKRVINQKSKSIKAIFIQSCWYFGLLLAAASYICFAAYIANTNSSIGADAWGLAWLITPGILTWVASHTHQIRQRRAATTLSCITLVVAQVLIIENSVIRSIGLTIAIGLMLINAFNLRRIWVTQIHLGFGLSLIASLLYSGVSNNHWYWLSIGAVGILGLYQFRQYLQRTINTPKFNYISQRIARGILGVGKETKNYKLIDRYIQAADYWAIALLAIELAILSIIYLNILYFRDTGLYFQYLLATVLLAGAIIWRYYRQPNNLVLYTLVWLVELFTAALIILGDSGLILATTNIILGCISLAIISRLASTPSPWARLNLSSVPLVYAVLGLLWRSPFYNSYTGWLTIGAALIIINTPQQHRQLNVATNYLGLLGISLGVYELAIYQMQQLSGGSVADGLTILALIAAAIAFGYRLGAWWFRQRQQTIFNLSLSRVILVAHIHWAVSSILKIFAASIAIETTPRLTPISIATSLCLGAYAIIQGKDRQTTSDKTHDWWVYVGLVEIVATLVYSRLIVTRLSLFDPWRVIFTCAIALLIYQIPWQNFGWRTTPWRRAAVITPALIALVTAEDITYFSLLVTAAFYLRIAYHQRNLRWSYISLGFINWGIIRLWLQFDTQFIWLAGIISLYILYIAQFDPYFVSQRQQRHFLRSIGCGVICVAALFDQGSGIIPGVLGFGFIFLGLGLRIRAFLFSGTITLILTVIYQLITLVTAYAFLKWVVGLLAGIFSIVIAAGFEQNPLKKKLQNYNQKLQTWQ